MQLLYLVPEFPSQTHAFFWREIQALRSLGVGVVLVSTRRPPPGSCRHEFAEDAAAQTHYLFPPMWWQDIRFLLARPLHVLEAISYIVRLRDSTWFQRVSALPLIIPAARLAQIAKEQSANHLHVHSFANSAHVAALARVLGGCPYSLTLHGDLDVYGRDHVSKARLARFLTCVTAPLKLQLTQRLGPISPDIHLLWMGVDTHRFCPVERVSHRQQEPIRLLSVARLHVNKGHRFALRALQLIKQWGLNAHYTIVGDGPAKDAIAQEVLALGLEDSVELVGTRSESEVLQLLQTSDALLLTSVGMGEAAPVAVMEAMSCGLPVVCSIIGGVRDMMDDGVDGFLVAQEDVLGIARCVQRLIEDPEMASQVGRAARERAVKDFDSQWLARNLVRWISSNSSNVDSG